MQRRISALFALGISFVASSARAGNTLAVTETKLDPPTVISLGVQMLITDDDNRNATVTVRYRKTGTTDFKTGMPLWRVRPTVVKGRTVPNQFAGSIFDLAPDTSYDIELHAQDPDGFDKTFTVTQKTRPVPRKEPTTPRVVNVTDTASLTAALKAAKAGDVITLAKGTYTGKFALDPSGTEADPIFIRGADEEGTILDGGGGLGNVLEIYGSYVTIERLTIQNLDRALRFQGIGSTNNVVRRVHMKNVRLGIGAKDDQKNYYLCDNNLEGRLTWPMVYGDDSGAHANDDGIMVMGSGHVVCHNRLTGFGDSMKTEWDGARSVDFYGNESLTAYDNAVELDASEGNTRCFRNRFTNSWSPLSFQPIYGGPAYAFRNVVVNVVDEQQKLHSLGGTNETVGALVFNNTFVSAKHAINLQAAATAHDFVLNNNIYFGPATLTAGKTVDWSAPIDNPIIDFNGYFSDGMFDFGTFGKWANFAAMKAGGKIEGSGVLLSASTFASGLAAPADYKPALVPADVTLAAASLAIDKGKVLPNVTDDFKGTAPDLGALELGCPIPIYGVRPEGTDETNEPTGCGGTVAPPVDAGPDSGGSDSGVTDSGSGGDSSTVPGDDAGIATPASEDSGGCGCRTSSRETSFASGASLLAIAFGIVSRRRRSSRPRR